MLKATLSGLRTAGLVAATCLAALSSSAQATVITGGFNATFNGSGTANDWVGYLGPDHTDLAGKQFTVTFTYDTGNAQASAWNSFADYDGGTTFMTVSLQLAGAASPVVIDSRNRGSIAYYANGSIGTQTKNTSLTPNQMNFFLHSTNASNTADLLTTQAGFESLMTGLKTASGTQYVEMAHDTGANLENLYFTVNSTFGAPPVVPEPSTLVMFAPALAGLAFYRRRRQAQ